MKTTASVKLTIYNEALRMLGERPLASISENVEPRRLLDAVYDANAIDTVLEKGQWKFALRPAALTFSPSVEPAFGYRYGFTQPTDMLRIANLCQDEKFKIPLLQYLDNGGVWFADLDTIYIRYVSNDAAFGSDLTLWTNTFCKYFSSYLALDIAPRLTQSENRIAVLQKESQKRLTAALALDAMAEPTKELPMASWEQSRYGGSSGRGEGGWC